MKITNTLLSILALTGLISLSGCLRDKCTSSRTYVRFDPVYKTLEECRVGISAEGPRTLK